MLNQVRPDLLKFLSNLTGNKRDLYFGERRLSFIVQTNREKNRIKSFHRKEPGTLNWISTFNKGDVFYDIGANIGIYAIPAATILEHEGRVYAFEPHIFSFKKLIENISLNGLSDTIDACCIPLTDETSLDHFNYTTLESGSTGSQLGHTNTYDNESFAPVFRELKLGISIDLLIEQFSFEIPDHIKIDVDGNEAAIITGMRKLLTGQFERQPTSIQIEVNPAEQTLTFELMEQFGYQEATRHYTATGQRRIDEGEDPTKYPYNVIFKPSKLFFEEK